MTPFLLIQQIFSLFLIMLLGAVLVRLKLLHAEDSRILSVLTIYLIVPCMILSAFQIEYSDNVQRGLLLAFAAAVLTHLLLIALTGLTGWFLHFDAVEKTSLIYTNSGNLLIPIITAIMGKEWVIYSLAYFSVQMVLMWSHGKQILCGETRVEIKKILTNINMVAICIGLACFVLQLRFPAPLLTVCDSIGGMVGPTAMLITGMLIGSMNRKAAFTGGRIWLIALLRLIGFPLVVLAVLKYSGLSAFSPEGTTVLMITLLAVITPTASTVTQMAQLYGKDADYASAITVLTTLLCILTMPIMIFLYQL